MQKKLAAGIGLSLVLVLFPAISHASDDSTQTTGQPGVTQQADATTVHANRAKRLADAKTELKNAITAASTGRDLAFADANATMMQALSAAGKDKVAQAAARATYREAAHGIIAAYRQAIVTAQATYKAEVAAIKANS